MENLPKELEIKCEQNPSEINWNYICLNYNLPESFIEKFQDKISLDYISRYQKLSESFIEKHNLTIPESSWMYNDKEWKRKYIQENTKYEIVNDKVIAYKSCRSNGYSRYNFQYHYSVGNTYESNADYNSNEENSFGLSAWTKEGALEYCKEKLFKVEIDIDDVACVVHNGSKIRATKIRIVKEIEILQ